MLSKPSISYRRSAIALLVSLAITVVSYVAFVVETRQVIEAQAALEQSNVVVRGLRDVRDSLLDMETGQRGYLLTGVESHLEPFHRGQRRLKEDLSELREEFPQFAPDDVAALDTLEGLAVAKEAEVRRAVELRLKGDLQGALRVVRSGEGKRYMDEVRALVESYADKYRAKRIPVQQSMKDGLRRAQLALGISSIALIVLVAVAFWHMRSGASRLKIAVDQFAEEAAHDPLTGLPNRRYLEHWLTHALARGKRLNEALALLYLDLDGFSEINNRHGHDAGDRVLRQVSKILKASMRESDFIARLGGDEFVVAASGMSEGQLRALATKIVLALSEHSREGGAAPTGVSIGIARAQVQSDSTDDLLKKADQAMYEAKAKGKNTFRFHGSDE